MVYIYIDIYVYIYIYIYGESHKSYVPNHQPLSKLQAFGHSRLWNLLTIFGHRRFTKTLHRSGPQSPAPTFSILSRLPAGDHIGQWWSHGQFS